MNLIIYDDVTDKIERPFHIDRAKLMDNSMATAT